MAAGTHTFGVKAKYLMTESEMVTTTIDVNHDGYAAADFTVSSNSKLTADGQKLNMLSTASGETYTAVVEGGKASFKALSKGQYLMNIGGGAFKEQSVNIDLTADAQYDLTLEDNVITPYNITADLTAADDGTQTALLKWNQDLGFTDSFEDYADFATGEFGGWKSIDNDKMPVSADISSTSRVQALSPVLRQYLLWCSIQPRPNRRWYLQTRLCMPLPATSMSSSSLHRQVRQTNGSSRRS